MGRFSAIAACLIVTLAALAPSPTEAAKWPDIPAADRALTQVAGQPNAPAVILLRQGTVHIDENSRSSYIDVYTRIKILTEEGTEYGTVSLSSSEFMRTKDIEGRTHLPDGTVVDLPKDATFEKEFSSYYDTSVTSCALPEVTPGSIVEYHYRTFFDSVFYPRVWYFQSAIPTLVSTVSYELPTSISFYPVEMNTMTAIELRKEVERNARGGVATYTMENLPPVPDEPNRFPFVDLSARVVVLPGIDYSRGTQRHLFDSWTSLVEIAHGGNDWGYGGFRKNSGSARRFAKSMPGLSVRDKAEAVYRWVRDKVNLEPYFGVLVGEQTADEVFKAKRGDVAELGLLLEVMLEAVGASAQLGWANPRDHGRIMRDVPNPQQFDSLLVVTTIGGEKIFLDPTDRSLGFGKLPPSLQAVPCLLVHSKKDFEWVETPSAGPADSARKAMMELVIDESGALSGHGALDLTGCHAWVRLQWRDTAAETVSAWKEWLEDRWSGFDITDVQVIENIEGSTVSVTWNLAQREEEVLGDEVVINPAAPLKITRNPYTLTPQQRATPVQLNYPDTDIVDLKLDWPESWIIDALPPTTDFNNPAGSFSMEITIDPDGNSANIRRTMVISERDFFGGTAYAALRNLYKEVVKHDAQAMVLLAE
jgi:hypothetical protein